MLVTIGAQRVNGLGLLDLPVCSHSLSPCACAADCPLLD